MSYYSDNEAIGRIKHRIPLIEIVNVDVLYDITAKTNNPYRWIMKNIRENKIKVCIMQFEHRHFDLLSTVIHRLSILNLDRFQ